MRICLLASGSKGNSIYIESGQTRLLLDAGLSGREIAARLATINVEADAVDALLVSHEHSDHSRGIGPLARRHKLPVYMHPLTRQALPQLGRLDDLREFDAGQTLLFRDISIETIPLTHDASSTVGYVIETVEGRIGVVTDFGIATRLVSDRLQGCRILVLESNHDEDLLRDGPYPWHLKQRIRSNHGHLSNKASAQLLAGLLWDGLEAVFLAHLSETNNTPDHARHCAREVLDRQTICGPKLIVGSQQVASECFTLLT